MRFPTFYICPISLPARILRNAVVNIVIAVANRAVIEAGLEPVFDARLHKLTANVAAAPAPICMRNGKIVHLGIPKRKARCVLCNQHGVLCAEKRGVSGPLLRIQFRGMDRFGRQRLTHNSRFIPLARQLRPVHFQTVMDQNAELQLVPVQLLFCGFRYVFQRTASLSQSKRIIAETAIVFNIFSHQA